MEEIEAKRVSWREEEVWNFMYVPKSFRNQSNPELWQQFLSIKQNWSLGRSIYMYRVLVVKAGCRDREWSATIQGTNGEARILHPDCYCLTNGETVIILFAVIGPETDPLLLLWPYLNFQGLLNWGLFWREVSFGRKRDQLSADIQGAIPLKFVLFLTYIPAMQKEASSTFTYRNG